MNNIKTNRITTEVVVAILMVVNKLKDDSSLRDWARIRVIHANNVHIQ